MSRKEIRRRSVLRRLRERLFKRRQFASKFMPRFECLEDRRLLSTTQVIANFGTDKIVLPDFDENLGTLQRADVSVSVGTTTTGTAAIPDISHQHVTTAVAQRGDGLTVGGYRFDLFSTFSTLGSHTHTIPQQSFTNVTLWTQFGSDQFAPLTTVGTSSQTIHGQSHTHSTPSLIFDTLGGTYFTQLPGGGVAAAGVGTGSATNGVFVPKNPLASSGGIVLSGTLIVSVRSAALPAASAGDFSHTHTVTTTSGPFSSSGSTSSINPTGNSNHSHTLSINVMPRSFTSSSDLATYFANGSSVDLAATLGSSLGHTHTVPSLSATTTTTFTYDARPVANSGTAYSGHEGDTIRFDGSLSTDDVGITSYEWDFDYSAGSFTIDATGPVVFKTFEQDFSSRLVALRVTDTLGQQHIATSTLQVTSVAPTLLDVSVTAAVDEGGMVVLSGQIDDPGTLDTFTLTIDWGDSIALDNVETIDLTSPPPHVIWDATTRLFSATHQYLDDNPSGTSSDNYTVSVSVRDHDMTSDILQPTLFYGGPGNPISIAQSALDGSGASSLIQSAGMVLDIEVDAEGGKIYWADTTNPGGTNRLYRANLDGTGQEILATVTSGISGVALDLSAGKVYFGSIFGGLFRANLDGSALTQIQSGDFRNVELHDGKIYWDNVTSIRRANLDGTNAETLVTGQSSIIGMHVVGSLGKMFWSDQSSDRIQSASLDGTQITTIATGQWGARGIAVDTLAGRVYWGLGKTIVSSNLDGTDRLTLGQVPVSILALQVAGGESAGGTKTVPIVVHNIAPSFEAGPDQMLLSVDAGVLSRTISFLDPGSLDVHTVTVDFGDGTASQSFILPVGDRSFDLHHAYGRSGTFTIGVTIEDDDLGSDTDSFQVTVPGGAVEGIVFNDINANGLQDGGEVVLSGITVFLDLNSNGVVDAGEPSAITGVDGTYLLGDVPVGSHTIALVAPPGWKQTFPDPAASQHFVTVVEGQMEIAVNLGAVALPTITLTSADQSVGEDVRTVTISATLDAAVAFDISVPILYQDITAQHGQDYEALVTAVTFLAGETAASFPVAILDDELHEGPEAFRVALDVSGFALLGAVTQNTITILDDDPPPVVSFLSATQTASEDTGAITVQARLSAPSNLPVTVPLIFSGSATQVEDYVVSGGNTIVIPAGQLIGQTTIDILDDALAEPTELIIIALGAPTNAVLSTAPADPKTHVVVIPQNDTPSVSFTTAQRRVAESAGVVLVEVRLSNPSLLPINVPFTVSGTASAADRVINHAQPYEIVIPAGQERGTVSMAIIDDSLVEPGSDETVVLQLGTPLNAMLGTIRVHTLAIQDNDIAVVQFSQSSQTVWEDVGSATFTVTSSRPSTQAISVPISVSGQWKTVPSGYGTYGSTADFTVPLEDIVIPAGATSASRIVTVRNDSVNEPTEQIVIGLRQPSHGAQLGDIRQHTIRVQDDDPWVTVSNSKDSVVEANTDVHFTIKLSAPTNKPVTVPFTTTGTAALGVDYTITPASTITIPAGQMSRNVTVSVKDDLINENNETAILRLGAPTGGAKLATKQETVQFCYRSLITLICRSVQLPLAQSTITIVDNDGPPSFSWGTRMGVNPSVPESNRTYTYDVRLSRESGKDIYLTLGFSGAATRNKDYVVSGLDSKNRLRIPAGSTSATFSVRLIDDKVSEPTETIKITMVAASDASLPRTSASRVRTLNILDNDVPPQPSYGPGQLAISTNPSVVNYSTVSGSSAVSVIAYEPMCNVGTLCISTAGKGFLDGATAFFDANFNGVLDFLDLDGNGIQDEGEPAEPSVLTQLDGSFALVIPEEFDLDEDGVISANEGRWVVAGGLDTAIDLPLRLRMSAAMGHSIVTPLSTVVERLVTVQGFDLSAAETRVQEAFGIVGVDLSRTNPLYGAVSGDQNAAAAEAASVRLYVAAQQIADLFAGTPGAPSVDFLGEVVFQDIAEKITEPDSLLDLSIEAVVASVIWGVSSSTGILLDPDPETHEAITTGSAQVIAAGNQAIDALTNTVDLAHLTQLFRVKKVMLGQAAPALRELSQGIRSTGDVVHEYTGASLQDKIGQATVGTITPPVLGIQSNLIVEGDSGQQMLELTVQLVGEHERQVTVDFATQDGTATQTAGDYAPVQGTLTWTPGDNSDRIIQIPVHGNTTFEPDKYVTVMLSNPSNAVIRSSFGFGFILNDDAFEHAAPANPEGGENVLILSFEGNEFSLLENGQLANEGEITAPVPMTITGQDDLDDTLEIDFTNGMPGGHTIRFHGGDGGYDTARIVGGEFQTIVQSLINATDGSTTFIPLDSGQQLLFHWLDLEPFLLNVGSVADLIFELPPGATDAVLEDADPTDEIYPGMMQLRSPSGAFETTLFVNPIGSITIRAGDGADSIVVASVDPGFVGAIVVAGAALGADVAHVELHADAPELHVDSSLLRVVGSRQLGILNLTETSTLSLRLDGPGIYDRLIIGESVALNMAALDLVFGFTPDTGETFTIVSNDGGQPLATNFFALEEGAVLTAAGLPFHITYAGDNSDVVLTRLNRPPTIAPAATSITGEEGSPISMSGIYSDPDGDAVLGFAATVGEVTRTGVSGGEWTWSYTPDDGPAGPTTVTITINDGQTEVVTSFSLVVDNGPPTATLTSNSPVTYGQAVIITFANAFDPSPTDTTAGFRYAFSKDPDEVALTTYSTGSLDPSESFLLDAGTYTLYARIFDKDGDFRQYQTEVTVNPAWLTITSDHQSKVYGETDPVLTFNVSGLRLGDLSADVLSGALSRVAGENVGNYNIIQGTLSANSNYTIDFTGNNFNISPATLTIAADDQSKVYGTADPVLSYSVSGLQLSDDEAAVLSGLLARVAGENAGSYSIEQGSLAANANYTISFTGADLEITQRSLTISAAGVNKLYDGTTVATVTLSDDRLAGDDLTLDYGAAHFVNKNVGTGKPIGVSDISLSGTAAGNYTFNTGALTTADITSRHVTGSFIAESRVYDGTTDAEVLTRLLSNTVSGDDVGLTGGAASFADRHAGIGKSVSLLGAALSGADAGNYILDLVADTLASITSRPASWTTNNSGKVFGENDPHPLTTGSGSGFLLEDEVFAIYERELGEDADDYDLIALLSSNMLSETELANNYAITNPGAIFTIREAVTSVGVDVSISSPLYGIDGLTLTASVSVVAGAGDPAGSVTFYDGATVLGTVNIISGTATLQLEPTTLAVGAHTLRAVYSNQDGNFAGSEAESTVTVLAPSSIQGMVYVDFNNNGEVDFGESGVADAMITLTGIDDLGQPVHVVAYTDADGVYIFVNLRPSNAAGYTLIQTQPAGLIDGLDTLGMIGGLAVGTTGDDIFSGIMLADGKMGENYNFGERPATTGAVGSGQTAAIGFWQNKNGQNLITSLNGGADSTQLGDWLAATFGEMYGSLAGKSNTQVASHYKSLFALNGKTAPGGPPKTDAQVMATALAVYATNHSLAGNAAVAYGFQVTTYGVGAKTFNVGNRGAAFGVANNTSLSVMDLLLAVNVRSKDGLLYDLDGNGLVNSQEQTLRTLANDVFSAINELGGK